MTYPPPPGPPGADGWPGGDPNQMPPTDPYGAGAPGGYPAPQPDPYGAPASGIPGPDPYGAPASGIPGSGIPGSDPYASNPYSAPPGYGPPQPGMPGMPGPGMPPPGMPGVPPPAPSSSSTGWIVGGVIGVVVILLGVVGVLFATGAFDSGPDSTDTAATDGKDDKSDEPKDDGKETDGASESGEYKLVEQLCDNIDLSGFTSYADLDGEPSQSNTNNDGYSYTTCYGYVGDILGEYGSFNLTVTIFDEPDGAVNDYDFNTEYMTKCDSQDEAKGSWEKGQLITSKGSNTDCYVGIDEQNTGLFVMDGNLTLKLTFGTNGKLSDGKEGDVLNDVAEQLLAVSAA